MDDFEKVCFACGFYFLGACSCPSNDLWYACPLEHPTNEDFDFCGDSDE